LQDNGSIIDTTEQKLMDSQNLGELHREIASKTADAKIIDLASIKKQKLDVTIQKTAAEIQQSRMRRIAHFQASRVGYMIRRNGEKVMLASDIPLQPQIDRIRRMTAQGNSRTFYLDIETNPHAAAGFQLQEYGSKSGTNAAREFQVIENLSKKDDLTYRRGRTITLLHNIAKDIKNHDFVVTQGNYDLRTLQAETQAHIDYFKHQISGTFSDRELAHFGREAVVDLRKNRKFFDKEGNKLPGVLDHHVTAERLRLIEEKKKLVLDTRANNKDQSEQFIKVLESIQEQFRSAEDHKIIQSDFMYALAGMGESGRVSQSAMAPKFGLGTNRHSASTDVGQMFDLTELAQSGQFQDELQHNINSQGIIKSLAPNENLTDGQIRLITAPGDRSFGTIKESFYYEKENVRMEKDLSLGRDIVELQRGYRLSKGTDGVYRALPSMWVNENNSAFSPSLAANRFNYESIEANYNNLNGLSPETANGFGTGKWVEDLNHDYMLRAIGDTNPSLNRTFRTDSLVGDSMTHESKNGSYFSKKILAERAAIPHFDSLREELSQLADKAFLEMKEEMGGQGEFAHASLLDLMKHRALLVGMDEHSREADKLRYHYIPTMLSIGQKFLDQADELISNRALEVMKATNSNSDPFGFAILKDVFGKALLGQDDRYTALLETHNTYSDKI
ncbi:MAG: hypothetical protein KGI25_10005, partial [Thaumarchaeota archaeon]|nr:hypothetical protein [Nitrososphaerota archaeon]